MTVIDDRWWYNASIWGKGAFLNDLQKDPELETNTASDHPEICRNMLQRAVEDAGGTVPEAFKLYEHKPGCTPFNATSRSAILKQVRDRK
jgi:hypothetical protein